MGHDGARKGHDRRRARAARGAPGREGLGCSRRALPLVGISAGEESFAALSVSLGEVRDHGRARLQALAETCGFAGRRRRWKFWRSA